MIGQVSGLDGLLAGLTAASWVAVAVVVAAGQTLRARCDRSEGQVELLTGLLKDNLANTQELVKSSLGLNNVSAAVTTVPNPTYADQPNNFRLDDSQPWLPAHELNDRSMLTPEEIQLFSVPDNGKGGWVGPE